MKISGLRQVAGLLRAGVLAVQDRIDTLTRRATPRQVLRQLNERALSFFDRKLPVGDKYPYEVHYGPALKNVPEGLGAFHLVGRNWRVKPDAPVALAFGFNTWKLGFMADYCPDVRIAFAPRKFLGWGAMMAARRMRPRPTHIYVWGYTDQPWLARFAKRRNVPLIRVEDAFIRSADLGANHATPYSLVFDSKGLYYNTSEPNDLADILAEHDFAGNTALMENAENALRVIVENGLSKYNLPDGSARRFRAKTRRRIVVIGQVDNDAAVRMGNPGGWRMGDIVRLARLENPDAEILYRPHPEVYRGHQNSRFNAGLVENIAEIVPPEGSLVDLLLTTDQVYTISSLSGLEALIRGVKVTTLGTPFYSGWGATDDRTAKSNGRKLTPLQIFAAAYLLYPRYLVPITNKSDAIESTGLRILADRKLAAMASLKTQVAQQAGAIAQIIAGPSWPSAVLGNLNKDGRQWPVAQSNADRIPLASDFRETRDGSYQLAVLCLLTGWIDSPDALGALFRQVAPLLAGDVAGRYFNLFTQSSPSWEHHRNVATYLRGTEAAEDATRYLRQIQSSIAVAETTDLDEDQSDRRALHTERQSDFYMELAQAELDACKYDNARDLLYRVLLLGHKQLQALKALVSIEVNQFNTDAAQELSRLLTSTPDTSDALRALLAISENYDKSDVKKFADINSTLVASSPAQVARLMLPMNSAEDTEEFRRVSKLIIEHVHLSYEYSISQVNAFIAVNESRLALEVATVLYRRTPGDPRNIVALSQALVADADLDGARRLLDAALAAHPYSVAVYKEALRVCILRGDYLTGETILNQAVSRKVSLGEMTLRKMLFGLRRPGEALLTFRDLDIVESLRRHFPDRYYTGKVSDFEGQGLFATALFGPGDEIRFASIYADMLRALDGKGLLIGCEPRLQSLFSRSFPGAVLVPVARKPRKADAFDRSKYNAIRNAALRAIIDNNAVEAMRETSATMVATDALGEFRPTYEAFPGNSYLVADSQQTMEYRNALPPARLYVGISWRSSLNTFSRTEHYLSVDELFPVFALEGIQFVNLQYDECSEEIGRVNEKFPGRLFDPHWLDQYNELDKVASLISAVDLVISPATTVVELAGALGAPTWMMSNSSELHWRKLDGGYTDVWHHSMTHVEGKVVQDKASLVQALRAKLEAWRNENVDAEERRA